MIDIFVFYKIEIKCLIIICLFIERRFVSTTHVFVWQYESTEHWLLVGCSCGGVHARHGRRCGQLFRLLSELVQLRVWRRCHHFKCIVFTCFNNVLWFSHACFCFEINWKHNFKKKKSKLAQNVVFSCICCCFFLRSKWMCLYH